MKQKCFHFRKCFLIFAVTKGFVYENVYKGRE